MTIKIDIFSPYFMCKLLVVDPFAFQEKRKIDDKEK
jgi:hypothetical protein